MALNTSAGTLVYIGPATKVSDETALAALSYVAVSKIENIGEIGPQSTDVTFTPLGGDDVQHLKGATDNGSTAIALGNDPLDPGQVALRAASLTKFEYAVKIVIPDAQDPNDTDTVVYVRGPIMSGRLNIGGADDVTKRAYAVGNNVFIEVPSVSVT